MKKQAYNAVPFADFIEREPTIQHHEFHVSDKPIKLLEKVVSKGKSRKNLT